LIQQKTPYRPYCIINAASAGVATPSVVKFKTGNLPSLAVLSQVPVGILHVQHSTVLLLFYLNFRVPSICLM
jgi:hypothetical protein